jgi:hypothetical protein
MSVNNNVSVCVATSPGLSIQIDASRTGQKATTSSTERRTHDTSAAARRPQAERAAATPPISAPPAQSTR